MCFGDKCPPSLRVFAVSATLAVLLMMLDITTGPRWTQLTATAVNFSDAACKYAFGPEPRVCTAQKVPVWNSDGQRVQACLDDVVAYESDRGGWACGAPPQSFPGIFGATAYVVAFAGCIACAVLTCTRDNHARLFESLETV